MRLIKPFLLIFLLLLLTSLETSAQTATGQVGDQPSKEIESGHAQSASHPETCRSAIGGALPVDVYSSSKNLFIQDGQYSNPIGDDKRAARENYAAVIHLVNIQLPSKKMGHQSKFGANVLVGLNSPSYRFKDIFEFNGNFDFKINGLIWNLPSIAKFTISYDFKHPWKSRSNQFSLMLNGASFRIGIPFGY